ncbi:MAG: FG-GAP-like repeat-containing protein, partial [Bacteroidota bacterium]
MRLVPLLTLLLASAAVSQPRLTASSPGANAIGVERDADIVLNFDQPLDPASVTDANVRVFGRWSGVMTGTLALEDDGRRVRFRPVRPFMAGETVTVQVSRDLAASGTGIDAAQSLQFWTATTPTEAVFVLGDWIPIREPGEGNIVSYGANAGDLDGDGDSDLAVPNEQSGDVRVFLNDGTGRYGEFTIYDLPEGRWPSPSESADLNADGRMDLVIGNADNDRMSVMLGDGAGSFSSIVSYPATGSGVRGLAVFDADGDGNDDVVTANRDGGNVSLFIGRGDGTFEPPVTFDPGGDGETALAAGDANGDGVMDLFIGTYLSNEVILMLGDGRGGFTVSDREPLVGAAWMLTAGDVDGDGLTDVVSAAAFANAVEIVRSNGDGTLTRTATIPSGRFTIAVDLGDLDGDGDLDLVSSNFITGDFVIYDGDGAGGFTETHRVVIDGAGSCAVLHDRDGDGTLDVTGIDEREDRIYFLNRVTTTTEAGP